MNELMKLARDTQIVVGGALLYVILSFLDWQQVSVGPYTVGVTEWSGIGVLAALLAIVLLAWELARAFKITIPLGSLPPGLVSVGLALLLLVFTVITFLSHGTARHWPAFIGLILAIAIAVVGFRRAKGEGVEMPKMPSAMGSGGGSGGGSTGGGSSTGTGGSGSSAAGGDEGGEQPPQA
jgi:uncharacterized membrane protein YgcG